MPDLRIRLPLARRVSGRLLRIGRESSRLLRSRIRLWRNIARRIGCRRSSRNRSRCRRSLRTTRRPVAERPTRRSGPARIRSGSLRSPRPSPSPGRIRPRVELRSLGRLSLEPRHMPSGHRHIHSSMPTVLPRRVIRSRGLTRSRSRITLRRSRNRRHRRLGPQPPRDLRTLMLRIRLRRCARRLCGRSGSATGTALRHSRNRIVSGQLLRLDRDLSVSALRGRTLRRTARRIGGSRRFDARLGNRRTRRESRRCLRPRTGPIGPRSVRHRIDRRWRIEFRCRRRESGSRSPRRRNHRVGRTIDLSRGPRSDRRLIGPPRDVGRRFSGRCVNWCRIGRCGCIDGRFGQRRPRRRTTRRRAASIRR